MLGEPRGSPVHVATTGRCGLPNAVSDWPDLVLAELLGSGTPAAVASRPYSPRRGGAEANLQQQAGKPAGSEPFDKDPGGQTGPQARSIQAGPCRWGQRALGGALPSGLRRGQGGRGVRCQLTGTVANTRPGAPNSRAASALQPPGAVRGRRRRTQSKRSRWKPIPSIRKRPGRHCHSPSGHETRNSATFAPQIRGGSPVFRRP